MTRLLKDFNSFPGAPKSLVGALNNLIFTSSALNELKPILDNFASVPTETQEAIPLEKIIDEIRRDVYLPVPTTNFTNRPPQREAVVSDYKGNEISLMDIFWDIELGNRSRARRKNVDAWKPDILDKADGRRRSSRQRHVFDADSWFAREGEIRHLVDSLEIQLKSLEALVAMLQTTSKRDLHDLQLRCARLTVVALEQNSDLTTHIKTIEVEYPPTQIDYYASTISEILAVLPQERLHYGCQAYIQACVTSHPPASSLHKLASLDTLNYWTLPVLPIHITNSSWYRFPFGTLSCHLPETPSTFTISLILLTRKIVPFTISAETTCLEIKQMIGQTEGIYLDQQYLVSEPDYRWLPESVVLVDRGITEGTRIHVLFPLWGRERL
ncbi:hypothetical protein ACEPPN_006684 [Leptodophora sp. 'Broadleaf-Isolate-01']